MKAFFLSLQTINKRDYFLVYALFNVLFLYLLYGVISNPVAYVGDSPKTIKIYRVFTTIMYFISPLYEYIKIYVIAKIIQRGVNHVLNIKSDFGMIFLVVLTAQFSMLLADAVKSAWLLFIDPGMQMHKKTEFSPLSLFSLFGREKLNYIYTYYYPLKLVNVFEALYWALLTIGLSVLLEIKKGKAFTIVLRTYGVLILIIMVLKFLVNYTIFGL